jgi:hypothetical protein
MSMAPAGAKLSPEVDIVTKETNFQLASSRRRSRISGGHPNYEDSFGSCCVCVQEGTRPLVLRETHDSDLGM